MSDYELSAIEALYRVILRDDADVSLETCRDGLRAAFDQLEMETEDAPKGVEPFASADVYRLVSRWMPVEKP